MSSTGIILEPSDIASGEDRQRIDAVTARCLELTVNALRQSGVATDHEARALIHHIQDVPEDAPPLDILHSLARMQGSDEEHMSPAIARLADAVASTMPAPPPLIPFAGKLIAPSSFYESFGNILAMGQALLAPVIYAEDTDALGVASINPFAARLLAAEIHTSVESRFGIKPFLSVCRVDYESWAFLIRKHFAL